MSSLRWTHPLHQGKEKSRDGLEISAPGPAKECGGWQKSKAWGKKNKTKPKFLPGDLKNQELDPQKDKLVDEALSPKSGGSSPWVIRV